MKKHIKWFVCAIVLLMGCSPKEKESATLPIATEPSVECCPVVSPIATKPSGVPAFIDGGSLDLDGITYGSNFARVEKDGFVHTLIVVFPRDQHYFPFFVETDDRIKGAIYWQEERGTVGGIARRNQAHQERENKIADVDLGYIYFVDDKRIVARVSNEDLDVDASTLDHFMITGGLRRIIERLIREHINPQVIEMVEPNHADP